ncbi:hypothetical protein BOO69_18690 (plasmid) [Sulfitobacter alexandrii]|uniref:DUF1468 domain-containing protein n=1 Tax=Sulfitobacter alexandrii TaxID=1917485 RepID=A0A1J0WMI9_9RHOB|nr:tripartite tricarboxylate transporter TctB family protein [Sulfitobacter alexandrii]APE45601.1 hypothetical protein BOO69_18690 [Sulfitobacter alexandrii]
MAGLTPKARGEAIGEAGVGLPTRCAALLLPAVLLAAALLLPGMMFAHDVSNGRHGIGPDAWPDIILDCLAFFAAIWLAQEVWTLARGRRSMTLRAPADEETYDFTKALIGLVLIILYGAMIHLAGFALTTAIFIAVWCIYGGVTRLTVVIPVSLIGTIVLLWLFMGLALMPLSRGQGAFDQASIWLLRTLGIY